MRTFTQQLPDTGGFIFRMLLACFLVGGTSVSLWAQQVTITTGCTVDCTFSTISAAMAAASPGSVITLSGDVAEGRVDLDKAITIDGGGFTFTATTSANYGFEVEAAGVTIQNIIIDDAPVFGIHTSSTAVADNLMITNVTVNGSGGTGITINCADNVMMSSVTATNNGGNGMSLTNVTNLSITDVTTNGNAFSTGGFGSGIGIFNTDAFCPGISTSGVTIGGAINISESPMYYEQASGGSTEAPSGTMVTFGSGSSTAPTHIVEFSTGGSFPFASKAEAITFAGTSIAGAFASSPAEGAAVKAVTTVREITTNNYFVSGAIPIGGGATIDMSVEAAINAAPTTTDVVIEVENDWTEGLITIDKPLELKGTSNKLTSTSASYGIAIRSNDVKVENLTIETAGTFGIHTIDSDNLTLMGVTTDNNGRTGIAINCSDMQVLTDITSTNNGGNGITITNTSNVAIMNITTSGNAFGNGFGAGVSVSNTNRFCESEATSSNVTIGGVVMIAEVPAFYEEADNGGAGAPVGAPDDTVLDLTNPGTTTMPNNFFAEFSGGTFGSFGYPDLDGAIQFAGGVIFQDQNSGAPTNVEDILTVRNAAGDTYFVKTVDVGGSPASMEIVPAISLLPTGSPSTLEVGAGTYTGNLDLSTKQVTFKLVD